MIMCSAMLVIQLTNSRTGWPILGPQVDRGFFLSLWMSADGFSAGLLQRVGYLIIACGHGGPPRSRRFGMTSCHGRRSSNRPVFRRASSCAPLPVPFRPRPLLRALQEGRLSSVARPSMHCPCFRLRGTPKDEDLGCMVLLGVLLCSAPRSPNIRYSSLVSRRPGQMQALGGGLSISVSVRAAPPGTHWVLSSGSAVLLYGQLPRSLWCIAILGG